jgi:hypothetical protein
MNDAAIRLVGTLFGIVTVVGVIAASAERDETKSRHHTVMSAIFMAMTLMCLLSMSCTSVHVGKRPGKMFVTGETVRVDVRDEPVMMANVIATQWIICHGVKSRGRSDSIWHAYHASVPTWWCFNGKWVLAIPNDFHQMTGGYVPQSGDLLIIRQTGGHP